ncbi:MAG: class II glutamine amidotransferase [Armatimonadota bacterium]
MKNLSAVQNPYGDDKVISNCSIFGMMNQSGRTFSGSDIMTAIANMHDRGNGLGGGFAVYGLYPDWAEFYAAHIMFSSDASRKITEDYLGEHFVVAASERIPTRTAKVENPPDVWRYFLEPRDEEFVTRAVMEINTTLDGAFVFSCGKNMGVFKGVGFPEDVGDYFRLEEYEGYIWTAHGRFPTNTQAWWGGAHPFSLLDYTVVHNGEISSYGTNRRFLEMFGYECTMHTDTEVIVYAVDLLMRRHGLTVEQTAKVLSPPLWSMLPYTEDAEECVELRQIYSGLLMNGPFTVIIAREGEMIGLTDRVRLRPLVAGTQGDMLYLSSEESSIRLIAPELDRVWSPMGGEPVIGRLSQTAACRPQTAVEVIGASK